MAKFFKTHDIVISLMNDGSRSPKGLRDEWSLLVHTFLDEEADSEKIITQMKSSELSPAQIQVVRKDLSSKRRKMNQAIEKIKIKIEQMSSVIENLELVGSDTEGLNKEIDLLNTEGEKISSEVLLLDKKISKLHELQDLIS